MTAEEFIRFIDHQARRCRELCERQTDPLERADTLEALSLLSPAGMRLLCLEPMDDFEAAAFRHQLREELQTQELPEAISS